MTPRDFISEDELRRIKQRCQKRIQRQFGVLRGHEDLLREMIREEINLVQDPSLIPQKDSEYKEETKERDEIENQVFEAVLESEHPTPAFADYERLKKADPDDNETRPPKIHPDVTHPRKAVFYLDKACEKCGCVECKCADQSNKGKYQIF